MPAAPKTRSVYRIIFQNRGNSYELYARKVDQGNLFAFVEVEDIVFGERSSLLVDPSEESLKSEFSGVKRTYIPLQSIVRIDEVEKEGVSKIVPIAGNTDNVAQFPMHHGPIGGKPAKK